MELLPQTEKRKKTTSFFRAPRDVWRLGAQVINQTKIERAVNKFHSFKSPVKDGILPNIEYWFQELTYWFSLLVWHMFHKNEFSFLSQYCQIYLALSQREL